jgi:hypothetical protein
MACTSILVAGVAAPWWLWLVPWILDFGSLPGLTWAAVTSVRACSARNAGDGDQA